MKYVSMTVIALVLAACSGESKQAANTGEVSVEVTQPAGQTSEVKAKAVLVYADWCASCKVLDPAVKDARATNSFPGVEFVVLDYTNKDKTDFYRQAEAAGVGSAVKAYLPDAIKTGQLLMVDLDDQRVLKSIKKNMDAAQIAETIKVAAAAS